MPTAQQDTEITLGTGRMLGIFFAFVLVCAFFFAIGFSFGRKTAALGAGISLTAPGNATTIVRPSPARSEAAQAAPAGDLGFYKAVGEKNADTALAPPDAKATAASTDTPAKAATDTPTASSSSGGYSVQVAAVSRQEDAEALVEALKKKQYPAFVANNASVDKFFHVQVGPYGELKDAEAIRVRLISDGYNPIVKK